MNINYDTHVWHATSATSAEDILSLLILKEEICVALCMQKPKL